MHLLYISENSPSNEYNKGMLQGCYFILWLDTIIIAASPSHNDYRLEPICLRCSAIMNPLCLRCSAIMNPLVWHESCYSEQDHFLLIWIKLIPAWIINHIHYKVWHEITYPIPRFQQTVKFGEWVSNFVSNFLFFYLSMLELLTLTLKDDMHMVKLQTL